MSSTTATEPTTEMVHADPTTLVIGANVRTDVRADAKEFAASIGARGVLEPITAYRDDEGALVVLRGQRRATIAAKVGTPCGTVPVMVIPAPQDADRIIDQVSENVHRVNMHTSETAAAVEQLALLGVSEAQIAKRTALPRPTVTAALRLSSSDSARELLTTHHLSIEDAAVFAEFDGDTEATESLERTLHWGQDLGHAAQRLRDEAADRQKIADEVARLREEGHAATTRAEVPDPRWEHEIRSLVDAEGNTPPEETCPTIPGAAILVELRWVHPDETEDTDPFTYTWICTDPTAAGLRHRHASGHGTTTQNEPDADTKREERRKVIEGNKAWRSAETVRRAWLANFITRKTPPAGAERLICLAVLTGPAAFTKAISEAHPLLRQQLLGQDEPVPAWNGGHRDIATLASQATTPKAATTRTLAAVLTAWEANTDVFTWRNPTSWDVEVLQALIDWGYPLAEIEQGILEHHDNTNLQDEADPEDPDPDSAA